MEKKTAQLLVKIISVLQFLGAGILFLIALLLVLLGSTFLTQFLGDAAGIIGAGVIYILAVIILTPRSNTPFSTANFISLIFNHNTLEH